MGNKSKKPKADRPLTDWSDAINCMVAQVKNGADVIPKLPGDMIDDSCAEAVLQLVLDKAGAEDAVAIRARRIKNNVLIAGKHGFYDFSEDIFRRIAVVHYVEKFEEAFASIERGDAKVSATLDAVQAAFAIGTLTTPKKSIRKRLIRQAAKEAGKADRPNAESLLTGLIFKKLRRNPKATNRDIKNAIIDEAENGTTGVSFRLEGDRENGAIVWEDEREKPKPDGTRDERRRKIRDLGSAISKARKKFAEENFR